MAQRITQEKLIKLIDNLVISNSNFTNSGAFLNTTNLTQDEIQNAANTLREANLWFWDEARGKLEALIYNVVLEVETTRTVENDDGSIEIITEKKWEINDIINYSTGVLGFLSEQGIEEVEELEDGTTTVTSFAPFLNPVWVRYWTDAVIRIAEFWWTNNFTPSTTPINTINHEFADSSIHSVQLEKDESGIYLPLDAVRSLQLGNFHKWKVTEEAWYQGIAYYENSITRVEYAALKARVDVIESALKELSSRIDDIVTENINSGLVKISTPSTETPSGTAETQAAANKEFTAKIKATEDRIEGIADSVNLTYLKVGRANTTSYANVDPLTQNAITFEYFLGSNGNPIYVKDPNTGLPAIPLEFEKENDYFYTEDWNTFIMKDGVYIEKGGQINLPLYVPIGLDSVNGSDVVTAFIEINYTQEAEDGTTTTLSDTVRISTQRLSSNVEEVVFSLTHSFTASEKITAISYRVYVTAASGGYLARQISGSYMYLNTNNLAGIPAQIEEAINGLESGKVNKLTTRTDGGTSGTDTTNARYTTGKNFLRLEFENETIGKIARLEIRNTTANLLVITIEDENGNPLEVEGSKSITTKEWVEMQLVGIKKYKGVKSSESIRSINK